MHIMQIICISSILQYYMYIICCIIHINSSMFKNYIIIIKLDHNKLREQKMNKQKTLTSKFAQLSQSKL
jgi:hypothetical protein